MKGNDASVFYNMNQKYSSKSNTTNHNTTQPQRTREKKVSFRMEKHLSLHFRLFCHVTE